MEDPSPQVDKAWEDLYGESNTSVEPHTSVYYPH